MTRTDARSSDGSVGCPRCRTENPSSHRFCVECGHALPSACPRCGFVRDPGARFCGGCGQPIAAGDASVADRFAAPDVYTPPHLAEKIAAQRAAVEGERKQVTVLYADVKGSLELLAHRDPEDARRMLDPVLALMMDAVHRYEGTVTQVLGDGVMAIFGAPVAHENHAMRAVYAALRMHDGARRLAEGLGRDQRLDVQLRVGLNSGEVVVRSIGSDLHMDYTAVGQTTYLAAQMERLARPGTTLLTAETARLAEGYFEAKPLEPVAVKGLAEPVAVHELIGPGPARHRLQAATVRGLSRFIGREAELGQLRQALQRTRAGEGRLVALVGEPGVGKSRVIREFADGPWMADVLVLEGRPIVYRKTPSWLPVVDALRRYVGIEPGDDARVMREKITSKTLALDRNLEPAVSALLALADLEPNDPAWRALDPPQRRRRIQEAVASVILAESRRQPVVLVIEDLQRIDEETQTLLDRLAERLSGTHLLIVVAYRPEYQHHWGSRAGYVQLRIDPFTSRTARALLESLLGPDPALEPLKGMLVERTDGNPLFLEESVRALVETQALLGEAGARRLARPLETIEVPRSVQAVLAARIDRLSAEAKHVLQSASVIGKDLPYPVLEAIADLPEEALRAGLGQLQAGELLYEASFFPEIEYTFKHALTHDVAYGSLLHETRRGLHARIVAAIERLYPGRLGEHVERLAYHALRGGLRDRAVEYLRQAGARAAARSAHREAVGFYEQALEVLEADGPREDAVSTAIDLVFDLRASLAPLGEFTRTLAHLRRAEDRAEAAGDLRRLGWISAYLTQSYYTIGQQTDAIRAAHRALEIGEALGDDPLQIAANFGLGQAHHVLGDHPTAQRHLRRAVAAVDGPLSRERWGMAGLVSVASRMWLAASLADVGEFDEAIACACDGLAIAQDADHPWSTAGSHMTLGVVLLTRGCLDEAAPVLDRGIAFAREMDLTAWLPMLLCARGIVQCRLEPGSVGLATIEEGVQRGTALRILSRQAQRLTWLAEAYLLAGRSDDAAAAAADAHRLATEQGERGSAAGALRMVAEATGDAASYQTALEASIGLGMRPIEALCQLGLAALAERVGNAVRAKEHATAALEMLRAMDMRYWLAQAESMLATGSDRARSNSRTSRNP
ncbi:MAG TPA: AAA family ATPase [Methylomirabilota bacterium]|nr:AAA family ATPase [Methylomirabilota bacterium]